MNNCQNCANAKFDPVWGEYKCLVDQHRCIKKKIRRRSVTMPTRDEILKRDFSEDFINKMKNAVEMSHYKYGNASKTYPELAQAYKCIEERLELYISTHTIDLYRTIVIYTDDRMYHYCYESKSLHLVSKKEE